jgi:hypothetical protein
MAVFTAGVPASLCGQERESALGGISQQPPGLTVDRHNRKYLSAFQGLPV